MVKLLNLYVLTYNDALLLASISNFDLQFKDVSGKRNCSSERDQQIKKSKSIVRYSS